MDKTNDFQFGELRENQAVSASADRYFVNYWSIFEGTWKAVGPFDSADKATKIAESFRVMSNIGECVVTQCLNS